MLTIFKVDTLLYWLAKGYHPQMEPESVRYMLHHFGTAMRKAEIESITAEDLLNG